MSLDSIRDRVKEAPWYNPDQRITIGGLGSIGSWLCLLMGRLVNTIYVYEFDEIEAHNLTGQHFSFNEIGRTKTGACQEQATQYNPNTEIIGRGKFEEGSGVTPICFSCFDSMKARKDMFESWKKLDDREIFIDGRLTAEQLWVYAVTPGREEQYEKYLFSDDEVDELPCSFKSTSHISAMIASYMVTCFTNYCSNKKMDDMADLPFEISFTAPLFMFEKNQII